MFQMKFSHMHHNRYITYTFTKVVKIESQSLHRSKPIQQFKEGTPETQNPGS